MRRAIVLTTLLLCASGGAAPAATAGPTFYGLVPGPQPDAQDAQGIAGARIQTARILINWRAAQPTRNAINWRATTRRLAGSRPAGSDRRRSSTDRPVGSPGSRAAADRNAGQRAGMAQLPPRRGGALRTRRQVLDHGVPKPAPRRGAVPVQSWQIWSEPNFASFDPGGTVASAAQKYATLLKISGPTVRAEDPKAQIVFAGMPGFAEWRAWSFLDAVYEIQEPGPISTSRPAALRARRCRRRLPDEAVRASMTRHADGPPRFG